MNENKIEQMKRLIIKLNEASDVYYNTGYTIMTDKEFDTLVDELKKLEEETGIIFADSPTQNVGYEVKSELNKIKHNHPMLSLDKTKSVDDIVNFFKNHDGIAMLKMDGLTCSLQYNGDLIGAETRGNGEIGEDILHNAKVTTNIPLKVSYDDLIVDGEMIIDYPTFEKINAPLPKDEKYKNPRNLASGSIRQLDSKIAKQRGLKFIAWKLVKGMEDNDFCERLLKLDELGFEIVPYCKVTKGSSKDEIQNIINNLVRVAEEKGYPIDGIVFGYADVAYGESLGMTGHHVKSQIAFKFQDDVYETTLREIEWSMGKTGTLCPVAIFDPVEIEGTEVSRASVHNVSILTKLDLRPGDTITVYKANMIIPQVAENLSSNSYRDGYIQLPGECPVCGGKVEIQKDNETNVLVCMNDNCQGKLLGKLSHAVSKNALNIEGLSEATLEYLIYVEWVTCLKDLFKLHLHKSEWEQLSGFGKKSVEKLLNEIELKRNTTLERFLYAQSIPLIGKTVSKDISKFCNGDIEKFCTIMGTGKARQFTKIDGFGDTMYESLMNWFDKHWIEFLDLKQEFNFITETQQKKMNGINLNEATFCITGKLEHFSNRDALVEDIELHGGKYVGSVTSKTNYLINNDVNSTSSKNTKAKQVGCKIISEADYLEMTR